MPVRLAFCMRWHMVGETLELVEKFDSLEVPAFPFRVDAATAPFLVIVWEGRASGAAPHLTVTTPRGEILQARLEPPKAFLWSQAQINSLAGFVFRVPGSYTFRVDIGSASKKARLHVKHASALSLVDADGH